jgi:tetratricopeptide (TPR) repeat protein
MNRFVRLSYCFALVIVIAMITGCASIMPSSVKIQNADRKFEAAEGMRIGTDTKEQKQQNLAKQKKLYDGALAGYLGIIEQNPTGKYALWSHFQSAEIYKKRYEWDQATEHYQAIVDVAPTGYLGGKAKSGIADIRQNRQLIQEKKRVYQNRRLLEDEESQDMAMQALYDVARAYQALGNYPEAIKHYERVVEQFSEHEKAPQAQFQIGNIYFYKLYDYSNNGGWGAFVKVVEKFPESYEASEATTLLKRSVDILREIAQDQDDIRKFTNRLALQYEEAGRKVTPSDRYVAGYDDRVAQDFQSIAGGWVQMKNYPFAIAAYRSLATNMSYKKFAAADALYWIGNLYQKDGQYQRAIAAFDDLFEAAPESTWRDQAVYQQAVCYRAIREFREAYRGFKAYMSLGREGNFYREAEQIVRQFELDQDGDGALFYQEQEAATSDKDPNDNPDAKRRQAEAEKAQVGGM